MLRHRRSLLARAAGSRTQPALLLALLAAGCSFNATGLGSAPEDVELGMSEGSESSEGSTSAGASSTTTAGDPTASGSGGDSATTGSGSGSTTTTTTATTSTGSTSAPTTSTTTGEATTGSSTAMEATTEPPCDDPQMYFPDVDEDTFGDPEGGVEACAPPDGFVDDASDCNDDDGGVYPGADEVCNGVDDDCDQQVDEYALTNSDTCASCAPLVSGDRVYYFCTDDDDWVGARNKCLKRGADLVSLGDQTEHDFVWGKLKSLDGEFWIGANDRDEEGVYVWTDGGSLSADDPRWAQDEPLADSVILKVDCVTMGGWSAPTPGRYRMVACEPVFDRRWICEGPFDG
ncbi:MAG: C-type lectin domain-containing protein [Nannocystaceae bacterium]